MSDFVFLCLCFLTLSAPYLVRLVPLHLLIVSVCVLIVSPGVSSYVPYI